MLHAKPIFLTRCLMALALSVSFLVLGGQASAETVRLNTDAKLRARPGERAPSITTLSEGAKVRIVGRQGRWLKVSAGGRSGWVTRTQVDEAGEPAQARETPTRTRKPAKEKARTGAWSSLDEDAMGEEAVEEDVPEVEDPDAEEPAPVVKKKAAKKPVKKVAKARKARWSVGTLVVAKGDATVRERPNARADEVYTAERGDEMKIILVTEDGGWVRVQDDEGTKGWVETKRIAKAGGSSDEAEAEDEGGDDEEVASSDDESGDEGEDDDGETRVRRKSKKGALRYSLGANVAFLTKKQGFTSDGMGERAKYDLSNNTPAVVLGGIVAKRMGKYELGAEGWYTRTVAGNGITVPAEMMGGTPEKLAWNEQIIDVRAAVGYHMDAEDKYTLWGRAGYHTAATVVDESVVAALPSETVSGYTVGAGLDAPKVTPKIAVHAGLDMLMKGKLVQTTGLTDGDTSTVSAYYLSAALTYKYQKNLDVLATYNLAYETFSFTGASTREPTAVNGSRKDTQHVLGAGVSYRF